MEYNHFPVLFNAVIEGLDIKPDGVYVDGTLGGGGHSSGILGKLTTGKLIVNDFDIDAIEHAKEIFATQLDKITFIHDDYKNLCNNLIESGINEVDGILLDLGVSSYQIDNPERGFSYIKDGPLDMRMNSEQKKSAFEVVNEYSEEELSRILFEYGEERYSRRIANAIVKEREKEKINSTLKLASIIAKTFPAKDRYKFGNPAKRTFQAIRIEVNGELDGLYDFICKIALMLKKGGRMCVITFHSLEDRIVKRAFVELEKDCICDKKLPVCVCNKRKEVEILTKKPIFGKEEATINKRSESAKLRIIKRV